MRFKRYLQESKMTDVEALSIFGLTPDDLGNSALIKKRYRDLVKTYHPDKIGKNDMMVKVNLAYEIIKKLKPSKISDKDVENLMADLYPIFKKPKHKFKGVYA